MSGIEESRDSTVVRIFIITTNDEAARLIGSRGATVTKLREEFNGITIKIGEKVHGVNEQVTELKGPILGVLELLMRIAEITIEPRSTDEPVITYLVHNAGGLIGTRGQRVTKIREESGATVKIADGKLGMSSQSAVTVSGKLESIEKATKSILEFISECEPVDIVYSPEMVSGSWGGPRGRRERRGRGRRRTGGRSRDSGWISTDAGRRGGGAGWGRGDFSARGGMWGNQREGSRDERWGGASRGEWGVNNWGARNNGDSMHDEYNPFEPTSSGRSFHGGERGWGKSRREERGWGSSSVGGHGDGAWGKAAGRARSNFGGRRSRGRW